MEYSLWIYFKTNLSHLHCVHCFGFRGKAIVIFPYTLYDIFSQLYSLLPGLLMPSNMAVSNRCSGRYIIYDVIARPLWQWSFAGEFCCKYWSGQNKVCFVCRDLCICLQCVIASECVCVLPRFVCPVGRSARGYGCPGSRVCVWCVTRRALGDGVHVYRHAYISCWLSSVFPTCRPGSVCPVRQAYVTFPS